MGAGLIIGMANYEMEIREYDSLDPDKIPDAMLDPRNQMPSTNIVRMTILITSILSVACATMRQKYKIDWLNKYVPNSSETVEILHYN